MAKLNQCNFIGRLVADPEARYTVQGTAVTKFRIAVDRMKEGTDFIRIVAFGKIGEVCNEYLRKGTLVYVETRYKCESYKTEQGETRYNHDFILNNMQMLSPKTEKSLMPQHEIPIEEPEPFEAQIPFK